MTDDVAAPINESQDETNWGVARATGVLALGNVISRVLGLGREVVLTNLFGATAGVDAFKVAILIPKSIFDLLIAGHVNGAIIPVLSEVDTTKGRAELWRLVSILLSIITAALALLVLVLQIAAPTIVSIFAGGSDAPTQSLAVDLLRITSPALIFMGLFAILSGTLYALRSFTWPAFGTATFNATIVVIALLFAPSPKVMLVFDGAQPQWTVARTADSITIMAVGWLAGSIVYTLLQVPGLRGAKLRPTLHWRHPALRKIILLYIPVMFSLVMDTLLIRPFSYNLASQTGVGNITYMDLATTLVQFPQGLVVTAISIAILPTLARQASLITQQATAESDESRVAFKDTLGLGLRLSMTLILPAVVGLFVLATPVIALLFEHGAFTAHDTAVTTDVLRLYLIGLPFAAIDLLLVYAFYARQDTLTPALVGLFSLAVYMIVAIVLKPTYGLFSLMIADSVKHLTHASISAYLLHRRLQGFGDQRLRLTAAKSIVAVAGMGLVAWIVLPIIKNAVGTAGTLQELIVVVVAAGISAGVLIVLVMALKIEEWRWIVGMVGQRLGRRS
jgi:putative peptidoglycan lipid II flippase